MSLDCTPAVVALTPLICRRGVQALQPLAGAPVRLSISGEIWGVEFGFQVPIRLGHARQEHLGRRSSFSSQGSETPYSRTPSIAISLGSANEAVLELRRRLSEPSGCSPSGEGQPQGRSVEQMMQDSGEPLDEPCLLRWLKARDHDVDVAEEGLRAHAAWRSAYIPNGRISEDEIGNELAVNKVFLQGSDTQGRPVIIVLAARHDMNARRIEETNRLIVYVLDNAAAAAVDKRLNPLGKFLCLFDLSGLRMNNLDVKALRGIFELLQGHFPERLSQLWFLNAPFIFWGIWRLVSPFIEPATRDKIVFLSGEQRAARLAETIPQQELPQEYGGRGHMVPIAQAVAARREGAHQERRERRRRKSMQAPPPEEEGRLAAARNAAGRWAASAWAAVKHGAAVVTHIRIPPPHLPPPPRIRFWWQHDDSTEARLQRAGLVSRGRSHVALVRQKSQALGRAVASSRFAVASRVLLNPKVLLQRVCEAARKVATWATWAWSHTTALRALSPAADTGPAPSLVLLPPSRLDGGLAPAGTL